MKITLGTKAKPQGIGSKRRIVEKEEGFVYIPILQTLQALLTNENVLSEVLHYTMCDSSLYYTFWYNYNNII